MVAMDRPLRVAYTLEQCWHDVPGGTAVATLEVLSRLHQRDDVEMIGVAGRHRHLPHPPFLPPIEVRQLRLRRPWLYETWNRFGRPRIEHVTGPIDVCHSTIAVPAGTRAAHVVTVHDVAFMHTPERFTRHGARVMRAGLERCRNLDLLMCPSNTTRTDLVELGFDAERIRVVPWGVSSVEVTAAQIAQLRITYALPDRFVLFVGTLEPRKNLARLVDAMSRLSHPIPLAIAGATGWGESVVPRSTDVRFLGFVPSVDLPTLYAAAAVFVYPSLQEGFGLPVLEAMAQGAPVVTSRGTATEEVAGGAAVLIDPTDTDSIAVGIDQALNEGAQWSDLGRARAVELTWDVTADATVAAYREVAAR